MFLLAAGLVLALDSFAQNTESKDQDPTFQRLGDSPVEDELDLQLTVPSDQRQPDRAAEPDSQAGSEQWIASQLAEADRAFREGRVDMPANDCAWSLYRAVLEVDPQNTAALAGLRQVQDVMIDRAGEAARELDFESAERILEDASLVTDSNLQIEAARQEISAFRTDYAEELEVRAVRAMDNGDFSQAERVLIELIALGGADNLVQQLRRRLEEARVYGGFKPGQIIRDHFIRQGTWTPESVVVLAGSFMMGSSAFEKGRKDNEGPQHRVTFRRGFAIGKTEVTVQEFRQFVERTRYKTDAEKHGYSIVYNHQSGRLARRDGVSWDMGYDGQEASDDEPVVHVSWNDATAYVRWLARGTGKPYRLPSEAEFEYAQRGGKTTKYWWGDGAPSAVVENLTGEHDISRGRRQWTTFFEGYGDKFWGPAPVASLETNPFGLFDIAGNAGEWVADCWHDTYIRAPTDGSAWLNPGCKLRVIRGGYWASSPEQARSAFRLSAQPDRRDARIGFRIARDL